MAYRKTQHVRERLADTRKKILSSAIELVSENGWDEAQISHVAASAGVAVGSVYRYFPSKADLFVEILSTVSQRELDVITALTLQDEEPATLLHATVSTFVKRAMRNPRLAYAMIAEPCAKEVNKARLFYRHAISVRIMELIALGQETKNLRPDIGADVAATVIVGGFMESLIGPLSPLNKDFSSDNTPKQIAVNQLANQIANACCAIIFKNT
jgi:AcrR family transcriptional regulator